MIVDPVTLPPTATLGEAHDIMARFHVSGVPITEDGRLIGILTNRDLRFEDRIEPPRLRGHDARAARSPRRSGTTLEQARDDPRAAPDREAAGGRRRRAGCTGLITVKDIEKRITPPARLQGRARPPARRGGDRRGRRRAWSARSSWCKAGVDALVVDSAHAHSTAVLSFAERIRERFADVDLVIGNVGTAGGRARRRGVGADAVKVGMGPGAICTTRVVTGAGAAQITAVLEAPRRRSRIATSRSSPTAASSTAATSSRRSPPARTR